MQPLIPIIAKIPVAPNNLFPLKLEVSNIDCFKCVEGENSKLWHDRFGHLNMGSLNLLSKKKMVSGLPEIVQMTRICDACQLGKQHRDPFPSKSFDELENHWSLFIQTCVGQCQNHLWEVIGSLSLLLMIIREKFGHTFSK